VAAGPSEPLRDPFISQIPPPPLSVGPAENFRDLRSGKNWLISPASAHSLNDRSPRLHMSHRYVSFAAANAPARVEFVSPVYQDHVRFFLQRSPVSISSSILPVLAPCDSHRRRGLVGPRDLHLPKKIADIFVIIVLAGYGRSPLRSSLHFSRSALQSPRDTDSALNELMACFQPTRENLHVSPSSLPESYSSRLIEGQICFHNAVEHRCGDPASEHIFHHLLSRPIGEAVRQIVPSRR